MTDPEHIHSPDTEHDILQFIGLLASGNPLDLDNQTAITMSTRGLYTPSGQAVIHALDRVKSQAEETSKDAPNDLLTGDFLPRSAIEELREMLQDIPELEKQVELTRVFMMSKHSAWAYRHLTYKR
ncbi:MAG: hypothetical protein ABIR37_04735 [Candidatus Saccharimonadales bacterium]